MRAFGVRFGQFPLHLHVKQFFQRFKKPLDMRHRAERPVRQPHLHKQFQVYPGEIWKFHIAIEQRFMRTLFMYRHYRKQHIDKYRRFFRALLARDEQRTRMIFDKISVFRFVHPQRRKPDFSAPLVEYNPSDNQPHDARQKVYCHASVHD